MQWLDGVLSLTGWRGRVLGLTLGAVAVLGHAPFHIWPLTLLALALLKRRLDISLQNSALPPTQKPAGRCLGIAGWFALGYFLIGIHWIGSAFIARGPGFIPLMPPMILGLAGLLALFWAFAGALYAKISRGEGWLSIIAFTSAFTLAEYARGHVFGGLPWNLPGYIFEGGKPISQVAAFIGIYGLTTLVFLIGAGLATIPQIRQQKTPLLLSSAVFAALYVGGAARLSQAVPAYVEGMTFRIVQVPFDQKDKFDARRSVDIVNQFLTTSLQPGLKDVTHIIWPEGAVNGLVLDNEPLLHVMGEALLRADDSPPVWLLNSLRLETRRLDSGRRVDDYYNTSAAVVFDQQGLATLAGYSDKHRLVPFGEFIPGGKWAERAGFNALSTAFASMSAAPNKTSVQFPGLPPASARICYEIIFPGLVRKSSDGKSSEGRNPDAQAPQWILNQSNDAWFGRSIGPSQHANQARYRAIEEGLPIIRAASNGQSGVINPYGIFEKSIESREKTVLDVQLPQPLKIYYPIWKIHLYVLLISILLVVICGSWVRRVGTGRN